MLVGSSGQLLDIARGLRADPAQCECGSCMCSWLAKGWCCPCARSVWPASSVQSASSSSCETSAAGEVALGHWPSKKNKKQRKAKLPRQGGPAPEGGCEKQDKAKLPRQGGVGGCVEVHGQVPVKVPKVIEQQEFVDVPLVEFVEVIVNDPTCRFRSPWSWT